MRVTMQQIAEASGVSRATVDKVLHERVGVSDEVRDKVKKMIDQLGYKPNIIGKALAYQKKALNIGIIIPKKGDPFYKTIKNGIYKANEEFKDFGLEVISKEMESIKIDEQIKLIQEFQEEDISGLSLAPIDDPLIRDELNQIIKKGVKVITFNSDINNIDKICFVGQDSFKAGRIAGDLMGKLLPNGGKIAIITGFFKIKAHNQRIKGFQHIIKERYKNIKIIEMVENLEQNDLSFEKTMKILKSIHELQGIYIVAGGVSGVGRAIKSFKKEEEIKVISFDDIPETVELVKEGVIDFTITQDPFMQGYLPVKILFEYFFKDKKSIIEYIETRSSMKTRENIDISERNEDIYK